MMMVDLCDTLIVTVVPTQNPVRLVLLDTGIVTSLSNTDLQNFKDVFTAVIMGEVSGGTEKEINSRMK
jgi:aarF domain-containing kinase